MFDKKYVLKTAKKIKGQIWYSSNEGWMYSFNLGDIFIFVSEKMVYRYHDLHEFENTQAVDLIEDFSSSGLVWNWWYFGKYETK